MRYVLHRTRIQLRSYKTVIAMALARKLGVNTRFQRGKGDLQEPSARTILILSCFVILGAFAKLRKVTISLVMSVRLSARTEQPGSHRT